MKALNFVLLGIIAALGIALIVVLDYNKSAEYNEEQIQEVIATFKEKYSQYEITEYIGSKQVPWKYESKTGNGDVELILGEERVILRYFDEPDQNAYCTIINPQPKDVLDYCPPKW